MLTALKEPELFPPPRKRLTRGDCTVLEMAGQLDYQRHELIDGDLIEKMPKNWPHTYALIILQAWLAQVFGPLFVAQEAPINVSVEDNPTSEPEPEPDLVVFNRPASEFKTPKRSPEELSLVIEVSDTTLYFDTKIKAALYARAAIVEYWVLDINGRRLDVHRDPRGGVYESVKWFAQNERIAPLAAPGQEFLISSAFNARA